MCCADRQLIKRRAKTGSVLMTPVIRIIIVHASYLHTHKQKARMGETVFCWFINYKPRDNIIRRVRGHQHSEVCLEFLQMRERNDCSK